MRLETIILPLDITITSYVPANPGRLSGPPESCYPPEPAEIEFEIRTLTGHELTESDFGEEAYTDLYNEVLAIQEVDVQEAQEEALANAWEARHSYEEELY